ncbi:MAG: hypothetical protein QXZ13_03545 [Candidatus Diapherotrites archaeon]
MVRLSLRSVCVVFAVFLLSNFSLALVEIVPKSDSNEIYVFERVEFSIELTNDSEDWLENASLKVVPSNGIYVMSGKVKKQDYFKAINSLAPKENLVEKFELYFANEEIENTSVKVIFGDNDNAVEKIFGFKVLPLPLSIDFSENYVGNNVYEIDFSITNLSGEEIGFLKVTLLPDYSVKDFETKEISSLGAFETFSGKIKFSSELNREQIVRIIFEDSKGVHYIEKSLFVNYKKGNVPLAILLVVLIVSIVFFYFKSKRRIF